MRGRLLRSSPANLTRRIVVGIAAGRSADNEPVCCELLIDSVNRLVPGFRRSDRVLPLVDFSREDTRFALGSFAFSQSLRIVRVEWNHQSGDSGMANRVHNVLRTHREGSAKKLELAITRCFDSYPAEQLVLDVFWMNHSRLGMAVNLFNWVSSTFRLSICPAVCNEILYILGKMRQFQDADKVFDEMPERFISEETCDIMTHNIIPDGRRVSGNVHDAKRSGKGITASKCEPDFSSFPSVMKIHARTWRKNSRGVQHFSTRTAPSAVPDSYPSKKALDLKRKQSRNGLRLNTRDTDILEWNVAISSHMRSGDCDSALRVFNSMPRRSSVSYNAMISGYIMNDKFRLAREMFDKMTERDSVSWNVMLSGYVRNRNLTAARELFEKMSDRDVVSWNTILSGYAQNGFVDEARRIFDKMPTKNAVSWNGLLSSYVQNGRIDEARRLFEAKVDWETVSWNCLMGGFVKRRRLVDARKLFDKMPVKDEVSWNTVITGYAQNGQVEEAQRLFDQSPSKDVYTWTAMVSGYIQNGLLNEARAVFDRMPTKNSISWNAMIAGYVKSKKMELAGELFVAMDCRNTSSWNTMITGYAQSGDIARARELFDEMPQRDSISWSALIAGYAQNGFSEEALQLFVEMERVGERLNRSSFTCALAACSDIAALELGKEVHGRLVKAGYHTGCFVGNSLLAMYCKCGSIDEARDAFREIAERDVVSWNTMIHGYARHGFGQEALSIFESMKIEGIRPDEATMVGVLSACGHAGLIDKGTECFYSMTKVYGVAPNPVHYTCMIDLLGRAGRLKEAQDLVRNMPFKPDAAAWGALLGASRVHGDIELGETVAKTVFKMEPDNSGMYVLLSNLYATLGRWPEVRMMRQKMKSEGVKKLPGYSWLEVHNKIHNFRVGETCHPEKDRIYGFLAEMEEKMKQEGFVSLTKLVLHDVEEEDKEHMLKYHSEKLAVAYGILTVPVGRPVRVIKNLRVCEDCHNAIKFMSKIVGRLIILRDNNRFHHFENGSCSCGDYW
ncbi:unnamed protein product [Linum tenue]|uniref:DYW domain-containing protein n=1 Tax=Linum tenue TaxID=586396 RepID=A0AAV0N0Y0_9ROSI|nr:unnamed protein product [Linum tenue]